MHNTHTYIYFNNIYFLKDFDGWTPLHAAAHWAQREACEVLVEHGANMEVKNCVGQTAFDVADPDVIRQGISYGTYLPS